MEAAIKRKALKLIRMSGAFDLMRLINRRRVLILTYHRFCSTGNNFDGRTMAQAFSEQLEYLKRNYRIVQLSDLVESLSNTNPLPRSLAAVTIDDGYRDAYEIAFPLLRRHGVPATIYLVTEFIEGRIWLWTDKMRFIANHAPAQELNTTIEGKRLSLKLASKQSRHSAAEIVNLALKEVDDEVKNETINHIARLLGVELPNTPPQEYAAISPQQALEMDRNGVEIGSHTLTHPILTKISDDRLQREVRDSRAHLESLLKHPVSHFCYPNGDYDQRVLREIVKSGYQSAVTTLDGLCDSGDGLFELRRVHTESDMIHFAQSTSGFEQMKNRLRKQLVSSPPMKVPSPLTRSTDH
ncbi:MAG: polysaccharide deacetylase family protein [Acidobacteria bacterium]|nr:polysaccharide deacetylase family protein [Acidobacteriota bacterium]